MSVSSVHSAESVYAVGGAGRVEAHVQGVAGDLQVAGQGGRFAEKGAGFVIPSGVCGRSSLATPRGPIMDRTGSPLRSEHAVVWRNHKAGKHSASNGHDDVSEPSLGKSYDAKRWRYEIRRSIWLRERVGPQLVGVIET